MTEKGKEVLVGGIVVATAVFFSIFLINFSGLIGGSSSYQINASFRSAEGINVGTDVRLSGVKIGRVVDLKLNPESYKADAIIAISHGVKIPDDSSLLIASESLLGGKYVEVVPGASDYYISEGDDIIDTQGSVNILNLLMRVISGNDEK